MTSSRVVTIVQRRLPHYRVALFECLRSQLAGDNCRLRLLHGDPTPQEALKNDSGTVAWAEHLPTHYAMDGRICWQPFMSAAAGSDLIIITQENKLLANLPALVSVRRRTRLAFWGHGRNMQAERPDSLAERFKRWTTRRVDWWFAYTELSAHIVQADGFPPDRITVLNNSIDTAALRADVQRAASLPRSQLREELGLNTGPVALFIGSLYAEKRIAFLLEAAQELGRRVPGFQLALAGEGPDRELVEAAVQSGAPVRYFGGVRGVRKAQLLAAADVMLNPGLVGLGILDAFVAGLPLLTTDCGLHSPEISYLDSGRNGIMTPDRGEDYWTAAAEVLRNGDLRRSLSDGAIRSGHDYSVERMAERFAVGVRRCIESVEPSR